MMSHPVVQILGPGGLLDELLESYEPRPQQLQMALTIHQAFQNDQRAVIEAATGTGKTLAYLIPAILSQKRVIISTATKALQSQILDKDIPLLSRVFMRNDPPISFSAVNLKGRSNYLCLYRFEVQRNTISFPSVRDAQLFAIATGFTAKPSTGEIAALGHVHPSIWQMA